MDKKTHKRLLEAAMFGVGCGLVTLVVILLVEATRG